MLPWAAKDGIRTVDDEINAPIPLPKTRPRSLTISCQKSTDGSSHPPDLATHSQPQSPFFRLPQEIRNMIYVKVLTSIFNWIHIVRKHYQRLGHFRCEGVCRNQYYLPCWYGLDEQGDWVPLENKKETDGGYLDMLSSCQKIYKEAIDLLYSSNTFEFGHDRTFYWFTATVLPQRLNAIRNLSLKYAFDKNYEGSPHAVAQAEYPIGFEKDWEQMCFVLANMENLQSLLLMLAIRGNGRRHLSAEQERIMLAPLNQVRTSTTFKVEVGWGPESEIGQVIDYHFEIFRRSGYMSSKLCPSFQRVRPSIEGEIDLEAKGRQRPKPPPPFGYY